MPAISPRHLKALVDRLAYQFTVLQAADADLRPSAVSATATFGSGTSGWTLTALDGIKSDGNRHTYSITQPTTVSAPLTITPTLTTPAYPDDTPELYLNISLATNGGSAPASTAQQIVTAINDSAASATVLAAITTSPGSGVFTVSTGSPTTGALSGGINGSYADIVTETDLPDAERALNTAAQLLDRDLTPEYLIQNGLVRALVAAIRLHLSEQQVVDLIAGRLLAGGLQATEPFGTIHKLLTSLALDPDAVAPTTIRTLRTLRVIDTTSYPTGTLRLGPTADTFYARPTSNTTGIKLTSLADQDQESRTLQFYTQTGISTAPYGTYTDSEINVYLGTDGSGVTDTNMTTLVTALNLGALADIVTAATVTSIGLAVFLGPINPTTNTGYVRITSRVSGYLGDKLSVTVTTGGSASVTLATNGVITITVVPDTPQATPNPTNVLAAIAADWRSPNLLSGTTTSTPPNPPAVRNQTTLTGGTGTSDLTTPATLGRVSTTDPGIAPTTAIITTTPATTPGRMLVTPTAINPQTVLQTNYGAPNDKVLVLHVDSQSSDPVQTFISYTWTPGSHATATDPTVDTTDNVSSRLITVNIVRTDDHSASNTADQIADAINGDATASTWVRARAVGSGQVLAEIIEQELTVQRCSIHVTPVTYNATYLLFVDTASAGNPTSHSTVGAITTIHQAADAAGDPNINTAELITYINTTLAALFSAALAPGSTSQYTHSFYSTFPLGAAPANTRAALTLSATDETYESDTVTLRPHTYTQSGSTSASPLVVAYRDTTGTTTVTQSATAQLKLSVTETTSLTLTAQTTPNTPTTITETAASGNTPQAVVIQMATNAAGNKYLTASSLAEWINANATMITAQALGDPATRWTTNTTQTLTPEPDKLRAVNEAVITRGTIGATHTITTDEGPDPTP